MNTHHRDKWRSMLARERELNLNLSDVKKNKLPPNPYINYDEGIKGKICQRKMNYPLTTVKNKYGVSIVKCCASCAFKRLDNRIRLCLKGEGAVPSSYVCEDWEMEHCLEKAGNGLGKIKTKGYLRYAMQRMTDGRGEIHPRVANLSEVRSEYLKDNETLYVLE